jgi:hypothetical protein
MKVTPDRDAPIIPKATKYHGDELLALKNVLLFAFLPVINEINSRILKYPTISSNIYNGFIGITILFANTNIYVLDYRLYKIIERLKS